MDACECRLHRLGLRMPGAEGGRGTLCRHRQHIGEAVHGGEIAVDPGDLVARRGHGHQSFEGAGVIGPPAVDLLLAHSLKRPSKPARGLRVCLLEGRQEQNGDGAHPDFEPLRALVAPAAVTLRLAGIRHGLRPLTVAG
ncbi:hypothetical protein [Streptomyces sp. PAN_FS17]|uniref:hypothetical protein n=1 Tax=Streptomyces sp. PAN_FS17 TaxID=1855351 RepID=UPI00089697D6|nr:hypothetical protein [Streptomyces sp. PAN_FS17]SEB59209.1 hypothetical protein SAMN05216482_0083 [Streptomyces sp. PAN_FS17]